MILQGGAGNAAGSESLANELADRFMVVTYDRRGLSRSTAAEPEGDEIAAHAADAARLIAAVSPEPAFVFGASFGALVGLELVARYGPSVHLLVAHEPPVYRLLKGAEQEEALRSHIELQETFQREGLPAAMKLMIARSGVDFTDREPEVPSPHLAAAADPQAAAQRFADLNYFFSRDVPAVTRYQPNPAGLIAAKDKIVPAVGTGSASTLPHRCAVTLAQMLGVAAAEFQGGHTGYFLRPKACAAKLSSLFQRPTAPSDT